MPAPLNKVVAFAAAETGAGRSVCAAKIALNLAQRSKCLVVDLDHRSRNLQSYLATRTANLEYLRSSRAALESCQADYVLINLPAGPTEDSLACFETADFPILVTPPSPASLNDAIQFLSQCDPARLDGRPVYLLVNRVQRGGEERAAAAAIEKARESLGLNIKLIGTVQYDRELDAGFQPSSRLSSATTFALEDIALRIERSPKYSPADPSPEPVFERPVRKVRRIEPFEEEPPSMVEELQAKLKELQEELRLKTQLPAERPSERIEKTGGFEITINVRPTDGVARTAAIVETPAAAKTGRSRFLLPFAITGWALLALFAGSQFLNRQPAAAAAPVTAAAPTPQPTAPAPATPPPAQPVPADPTVVHRAMPDVPQKAQHTISGTVRTSVRVTADPSGNVTDARIESRGPSDYFARLAMEAARDWKFSAASQWTLRFEFTNTETNVFANLAVLKSVQ